MSEIEKLIRAECAELNSTVVDVYATERFQLLHAAFTRVADAAVQGERARYNAECGVDAEDSRNLHELATAVLNESYYSISKRDVKSILYLLYGKGTPE